MNKPCIGKDNGATKILFVRAGKYGYSHDSTSDLEDSTIYCSDLTIRNQWNPIGSSQGTMMRNNITFKTKYFIGRHTLLDLVNDTTDIIIHPRIFNDQNYFNVAKIRKATSLQSELEVKRYTFHSTFYETTKNSVHRGKGMALSEEATYLRYTYRLIFGGGGGSGNSKPCPPFGCN